MNDDFKANKTQKISAILDLELEKKLKRVFCPINDTPKAFGDFKNKQKSV